MSSQWSSVPIFPPLEFGEVHLWRINLVDATGPSEENSSLLNPLEQATASRRRAGRTRDHFTIGRTCLKILLGNTLRVDPSQITLSQGPHGKPEIPTLNGTRLQFNVAHAKDTILIALSRQTPVGVDVEYIDQATDIMEVAHANFTENETASLAAIADPEIRRRVFYLYWTRKEAIVKTDGRGLLLPLTSFDVSGEFMDLQPVRVSESTGEIHASKDYFVSDLDLGPEAVGALALESADCRLRKLIFPLASIPAFRLQKSNSKNPSGD
ncbi:MAG: 4'-phosphopantetheinyl transferase superfamily protein [Edaphobacter sp.]